MTGPGRLRLRPRWSWNAVTLGVAIVACLFAAGRVLPRVRLDAASTSGHDFVIAAGGAWATRPSPSGEVSIYLALSNSGHDDDILWAVTADDSVTAGTDIPGHVHTLQEIENAQECGDARADVLASAHQLDTTSDLVVSSHGRTVLAPGRGRLVVDGVGWARPGSRIRLQLWFDSGSLVRLDVPVRDRSGPS